MMKIIAFFESIIIAISCFFGSIFNLPQKNVNEFVEQNGGFIYGVCHPNENYEILADAGLKWVRFDIPYPYNAIGQTSGYYTEFKERCKEYTDRGFKVMAVTPYPRDYFNIEGFNPVEEVERTKELAVFLYNDLKDITAAFQITNEMGVGSSFMLPLKLEEAAKFIGIQLEAINEAKEKDGSDFPIGYNSAYLQKDLQKLMKPYYQYCDYVGIDLYFGVQGKAKPSDYSKEVKKLYRMTRKPIIIEEFGFWSEGRPKTVEEKAEILSYYGYATEAEAIADGMAFVNKLPSQFRQRLTEEYPDSEDQWAEIIFKKMSNHFYGETSAVTINNIPHNYEGQAEYFKEVMGELRKTTCLAGMIIYCCQDMGTCWYCGQSWCPFETRWGLFDMDGNPKPSYYAVKDFITGSESSDSENGGSFFARLFGNKPVDAPALPSETITAPDGSEMHLVWNDEFSSLSLDSTKWTLRAKMNQSDIKNGTGERNVKVENGELIMRSWKEDDGKYSTNTSVTTDGTMSYKYGYLEMYANVPFVEGCWPSFWMQSKDIHRSVPYMTEIDIFEIYDTRNIVAPNIHKWYPDGEHYQAGGRKWGYKFKRKINLNNEYHLYGFGWTPDEMYFTVDGEIYFRYDLSQDFGEKNDGMQGFSDPVYIIFNNFIFTENSSWKNPPVNDKTEWPITYKIDWIRLYQKEGEGEIFDDTQF